MDEHLPPLTDPRWIWQTDPADAYTADQMRAYAAAAVAAERERCARVCENVMGRLNARAEVCADPSDKEFHATKAFGAEHCANAIRLRLY